MECQRLKHKSDCIMVTLMRDSVKRFNINAILGIDNDLKVLASFAKERFHSIGLSELQGATSLKHQLGEKLDEYMDLIGLYALDSQFFPIAECKITKTKLGQVEFTPWKSQ